MTLTLADLEPGAARAACPVVAREYRLCRAAAESAADRFHLAAERMGRLIERGLANESVERAIARFRRAYAQLDDIRDQLDREEC